MNVKENDKSLNSYVLEYLLKKGIEIEDLAKDILDIQKDFYPDLDETNCIFALNNVLKKREVLHPLAVGIQLDKLATKNKLDEPLQSIVKFDEPLFGVDETLAISMANPYGTIATTNFGYLDKNKKSVAKKLDETQKQKKGKVVNTFLDDAISALVADAAAYIAHNNDN